MMVVPGSARASVHVSSCAPRPCLGLGFLAFLFRKNFYVLFPMFFLFIILWSCSHVIWVDLPCNIHCLPRRTLESSTPRENPLSPFSDSFFTFIFYSLSFFFQFW